MIVMIVMFVLIAIYLLFSIHPYEPADSYWKGPYDVRVSTSIDKITAADGRNTLFKSGGETHMFVKDPISKKEYLNWYTTLKPDGYYYWSGKRDSKSSEVVKDVEFESVKSVIFGILRSFGIVLFA